MSHVIQATDQNFADEVENYGGPVMLEFFADWCPHCRRMTPVLKELAEEYAGKVKFVAVDIDESPDAAKKYGIGGVPAMFFIGKGKGEPSVLSGEQSPKTLKEFLDELL